MSISGTKQAAEALLLELPSVLGAFVREDVFGHPREIHLLVSAGPAPRHLARDIRDLLEERLGVPIDQRIVSIAQLAAPAADAPADAALATAAAPGGDVRLRFDGVTVKTQSRRIEAAVRLQHGAARFHGSSEAVDSQGGRMHAGAAAVLDAANRACDGRGRFDLETAAAVRAFGREFAVVTVLAHAPALGRRPVPLAGAQPADEGAETAAALAALKAVNRLLAQMLR